MSDQVEFLERFLAASSAFKEGEELELFSEIFRRYKERFGVDLHILRKEIEHESQGRSQDQQA